MMKSELLKPKRNGIVDVWNAFMVEGASFGIHDIPFCPTTATSYPKKLISWSEAKRLHNAVVTQGKPNYKFDAFVHFYADDIKFDGAKSSIWLFPQKSLAVLRHFDGIITPDFSMFQDFPEAIKIFAVYQMRAFGFWASNQGLQVINNVRWGTKETRDYCFEGVPKRSVVSIGTVASGLRAKQNHIIFDSGVYDLADKLKPTAILVYGSSNYDCFNRLNQRGIKIITYESDTSKAFARREAYEQD